VENRRQSVLVLDDDHKWAENTKAVVAEEGHQVVIATATRRAIDKASTISFDTLVLDLGLGRDVRAAEKAYYAIKEIIQDIESA
jgi:DNA-binding response OmpR family regulator